MMELSLFNEIIEALLPEMGDPADRKALVESALYQSPVLQKINWHGAARPFTTQLVRLLDEFGEIESGRRAIVALLEEVRQQVGADRQVQIDAVLRQLQSPASASAPSPRVPPATPAVMPTPAVISPTPSPPSIESAKMEPAVEAAQITSRRALIGGVAAAAITALGALAVAMANNWTAWVKPTPSPTPITFTGRVVNQKEEKIRGAKVSLEGEGVPAVVTTDTEGVFSFPVNDSNKELRLRVEAIGYENFDIRVTPARVPGFRQEVRLTPK